MISPEVTDTPVIAADLGDKYHYATPFGLVADPMVVNWSDLTARLEHTNAATNLGPLLSALPVGAQVLVVNPTTWGAARRHGPTPGRSRQRPSPPPTPCWTTPSCSRWKRWECPATPTRSTR